MVRWVAMHHSQAVSIVRRCTRPDLLALPRPSIDFVSPAVAALTAAGAIFNHNLRSVRIDDSCQSYADSVGLSDAIRGEQPNYRLGSQCGVSYSPLVKLWDHNQVEASNTLIANVLYNQLADNPLVAPIVKIIGELHDNVPSHANGAGFSAAQVYRQASTKIEFAIADCGCGMLRNVRRVIPEVTTHAAAIDWCLVKGNTTAPVRSEWAQRAVDAWDSPLEVDTFTDLNHHMGWGLWKLTQLIAAAQAKMWIWSGSATLLIDESGRRTAGATDIDWQGVAIELEFDVERAQARCAGSGAAELEALAGRLGL